MVTEGRGGAEAARLQELWSGEFGDEYTERNAEAGQGREPFWDGLLGRYEIERVLEVGCNVGANLQWIAPRLAPGKTFGVDVNVGALARLRERVPTVNAVTADARELPFRDGWFDLSFTTGVLIHQAPEALPAVMGELVRVSRRYVLCGEYFAEEPTEVPYRNVPGALFKRDFGQLYLDLFPDLRLVETGTLDRTQGWDDVTWWLFEKG